MRFLNDFEPKKVERDFMTIESRGRWRLQTNRDGSSHFGQTGDDSAQEYSSIHDCQIVQIDPTSIATRWSDGELHTHSVGADAIVTLDGIACGINDLLIGSTIRLTTKSGDSRAVSRIESTKEIAANSLFPMR